MGGMKKVKSVEKQQEKDAASKPREKKSYVPQSDGANARIIEVLGRTGVFGEIKQCMCKVLDGRDTGHVIRRNIKGPVRVGDIVRLPETERESKPLKTGRK